MKKTEEIKLFIEEEAIDNAFISESNDREKQLEHHIRLLTHIIISNSRYQWPPSEKGVRPTIIAQNTKYKIENLTITSINIPLGVEAWGISLAPSASQT